MALRYTCSGLGLQEEQEQLGTGTGVVLVVAAMLSAGESMIGVLPGSVKGFD